MGVRGEPLCPAAVSSPSVSPSPPPATHVPCLNPRNCAYRKHENSIIPIYIFIHTDIIKHTHIYICCAVKEELPGRIFFAFFRKHLSVPFSHQDKQNLAVNCAVWLEPRRRLLPQARTCSLPLPTAGQEPGESGPKRLGRAQARAGGQILPRKTPLTSRGLDGLLIRTAGFVSIFCLACDAKCPSEGWLGLPVDQFSPGASSRGGGTWFWDTLCVLLWGGAGMWDQLSQGTGPWCSSGQVSCCCPFQLGAPRPAADRRGEKICVTLGFSVLFAVGWSEGGMGKEVKRFLSSHWKWTQLRLKIF